MEDMGLYQCAAVNEQGSDVEYSHLYFAEAPVIQSFTRNITSLNKDSILAIVGDHLMTRTGLNVTLDCPVKGFPIPKLTWMKKDQSLPNNSFVLSNGSLLLTNISFENEGTYMCTATNVLGKTVAMTVLHLSAQKVNNSSEELVRKGKRRVLMASAVGTSVSGKAGDLLRIGCPMQTSHQNTIHWFFRKQPIEETKGFRYRTLVTGRVLEINPLSEQSTGEYRCWTSNNSKTLSAWVNVSLEVYRLEYGEWTPCSTSCGNLGSQVRTQHCVNSEGQRVDNLLCQHLQPLAASTQPCNIQDCPIRWATSSWSDCSATCGTGYQLRQVACQQLLSDGSVKVLALNLCGLANRPAARKPCMTDACMDWVPQPWGQCFNRCTGQGMGLQHRHIVCQNRNGTVVPDTYCDRRKRPASRRDCSSEMCDVYWRTGPWRPCTAACGNGFQSRKVDCVHRKNGKVLADQYCVWKRRPMTWQRCNITSCGKGECKDTTHYCTFVKQLKLCLLELYKQRCCDSCNGE